VENPLVWALAAPAMMLTDITILAIIHIIMEEAMSKKKGKNNHRH
jgi:hypothetical protein